MFNLKCIDSICCRRCKLFSSGCFIPTFRDFRNHGGYFTTGSQTWRM